MSGDSSAAKRPPGSGSPARGDDGPPAGSGRPRIRVLLAEDMHIIRSALVALLDRESDIEVVAQVGVGTDIVPQALEHRPDVAVLDVNLPGVDGLEAAVELHRVLPECRTLMLTSLTNAVTVRRALSAKVAGFVRKDAPPAQLADAIRRVHNGQRAIDPGLALAAWDLPDNPLSSREIEVVSRAAEGLSTAEIATQMHLSDGTVRNYLTAVVSRLNARNRIDAIRIARESGWI